MCGKIREKTLLLVGFLKQMIHTEIYWNHNIAIIRQEDVKYIIRFDHIARSRKDRRDFIKGSVLRARMDPDDPELIYFRKITLNK
jgi:hypothetical protein